MIENNTKLSVANSQVELGMPYIERAFEIIKAAPDHEKRVFLDTLLGLGKEIERMFTTLEARK